MDSRGHALGAHIYDVGMRCLSYGPGTWPDRLNPTYIPVGDNVTPGFKGKSECIEHMCVRIKFHTCVDSVYTKTQCKSVKRVLELYYMTECLRIVT
jgi:hypothetical protein